MHAIFVFIESEVKVKVTQSCLTLCDPMDYSVHEILQARILEWVAFLFSSGSSQPRDQTQVYRIAGKFFTKWAMRETLSLKIIVNSSCKQSYHSLEILVIFNGTSKSVHRLIIRFQIFNLLKLTKSQAWWLDWTRNTKVRVFIFRKSWEGWPVRTS